MTTPDPCPPPWELVAVMLTTLGETTDAVAVQSGADALPCLTGAEALLPSWVAEEVVALAWLSSAQ